MTKRSATPGDQEDMSAVKADMERGMIERAEAAERSPATSPRLPRGNTLDDLIEQIDASYDNGERTWDWAHLHVNDWKALRDAVQALRSETGLLRQLVLDCQNDLATYIVPDSGITEHDVVNTLLGRLDGPQSRAALAAPSATEPTEIQVQAGAVILATTPLIDAPKLSHNEWMGLSRAILEAAHAVR